MHVIGRWTILLVAIALTMALPLGAGAHDAAEGGDEPSSALPELEGLAWYRSTDLAGERWRPT